MSPIAVQPSEQRRLLILPSTTDYTLYLQCQRELYFLHCDDEYAFPRVTGTELLK